MPHLQNRPYAAMNGIGNKILIVDLRDGGVRPSADEARALAGHFGFDQLMTLEDTDLEADAATRIYNRDGSSAGACGNGTRCVGWFLMRESGRPDLLLDGPEGPLHVAQSLLPDNVTVDMGVPRFGWQEVPLAEKVDDTAALPLSIESRGILLHSPAAINVGNPHAIFFVEDADVIDLAAIGPALEHDPIFPDRANISVASSAGPDSLTLRVWERGAGLTKACGSAACATAVAAARAKRTGRKVQVSLPGGDLFIEWREGDDHILMTGAVELESEGRLSADMFSPVPA